MRDARLVGQLELRVVGREAVSGHQHADPLPARWKEDPLAGDELLALVLEQEDLRLAKRTAPREEDEEVGTEAQLGAVLPREHLPAEPRRGELPADPVAAQEIPSPSIDRQTVDEPLEARTPEKLR